MVDTGTTRAPGVLEFSDIKVATEAETRRMAVLRLQSRVLMQAAGALLAKVTIGEEYGITGDEYVALARPLSDKINEMLEQEQTR